MAAGLPVVCRNGNGNKDIHVEGETGFMIEDDNDRNIILVKGSPIAAV
jgi:hypothetical protein